MLKARILTAIVLIPVFIALFVTLPPRGFAILTGMMVLLGAFEWSQFLGLKNFPRSIFFPFLMIACLFFSLYLLFNHYLSIPYVMITAFVWWLFVSIWVFLYPKGSQIWGKSIFIKIVMGIMTLMPCWLALNFLRVLPHGLSILFILLILIWAADTGAYFAGKGFGKHKLLPHVSPGKTWEGFIGAMFTTVIVMGFVVYFFKIPKEQWLWLLILGFVTVVFSIVGDLFESMLKRAAGIKDSGKILPGHGGILDRIDSLTSAAPVFALGVILLGR
jgi:phosphatidate cytidylyltransferase